MPGQEAGAGKDSRICAPGLLGREAAWMDGRLCLVPANDRRGGGGCRRERGRDASQMAELLGGRASRASRRRCDVPRWMLQCECLCMQWRAEQIASKAFLFVETKSNCSIQSPAKPRAEQCINYRHPGPRKKDDPSLSAPDTPFLSRAGGASGGSDATQMHILMPCNVGLKSRCWRPAD